MDLETLSHETRAVVADIIERSAIQKGQVFVLGLSSSESGSGPSHCQDNVGLA